MKTCKKCNHYDTATRYWFPGTKHGECRKTYERINGVYKPLDYADIRTVGENFGCIHYEEKPIPPTLEEIREIFKSCPEPDYHNDIRNLDTKIKEKD